MSTMAFQHQEIPTRSNDGAHISGNHSLSRPGAHEKQYAKPCAALQNVLCIGGSSIEEIWLIAWYAPSVAASEDRIPA